MKKFIYRPLTRLLSFLFLGILAPLVFNGSGFALGINAPLINRYEADINVTKKAINITGKVTSQTDGIGLPGVNILVKGTSTGTVTDVDGNYKLAVPDGADALIFLHWIYNSGSPNNWKESY